ncbi:unnamed protein product [Thelazia callipaeda]|uniref:PDZ domain-containing protein n=1 Tax=Thelazia callipaeda TaxID=103827 RepID=A0A3P7N9F1_THECL|nr:unnamed protein product [Thelazia callipaeda]
MSHLQNSRPNPWNPQFTATVQPSLGNCLPITANDVIVAPITSQCTGLVKANLTHGIRKVILNRFRGQKYGMKMQTVNQGIFVQWVEEDSPAAVAGIRFGDQVLSVNEMEVFGMTGQKVINIMKKSKRDVVVVLRDRPLARTITLHKDTRGILGIVYRDNLIVSVVKHSSASRNGLLVNQRIIEVDGQNVMSLEGKELHSYLENAPMIVTLTLMPTKFYEELTKGLD